MATLDVLTYGFALTTDQGSFGYSTNSLLRVGSHNILIDTGPSSRRPFLVKALKAKGLETSDIDIVILTHMHWDHCQNTDLFTNARVLVHPTEIDYARNPNKWDLAVAAGMAGRVPDRKRWRPPPSFRRSPGRLPHPRRCCRAGHGPRCRFRAWRLRPTAPFRR